MNSATGMLWALAGLGLGLPLGWMLSRRQMCRQLTAQQHALERALAEARTDSLTKLWNRTAFDEQLGLWSAVCRRYGGPVSLILFDLDALKKINDRYGHAAGDAVLQHLAGILRQSSRESDFSARIGGDEFAILLPLTGIDGARVLAERICRLVEESPLTWGQDLVSGSQTSGASDTAAIAVQVSAGISELHAEHSPVRFFEETDRALYAAKQSGGNRVVEASVSTGNRGPESSQRGFSAVGGQPMGF
jgi:diguanylate cyclase (GGDEF)-like protein